MAQKVSEPMIDLYSKRLEEATKNIYSVFARYPLVEEIEGCTHCVFLEDNTRLHSKPLRDLQEADLSKFAHKAVTTWGDKDAFRHFLPRLFELMAAGSGWPISIDRLVASKLNDAEWQSWPETERAAIGHFLQALCVHELSINENHTGTSPTLYAIMHAGLDVQPYLELWSSVLPESIPAKWDLAVFINNVLEETGTSWSTPSKKRTQTAAEATIARWLLNPEMIDALAELATMPEIAATANQALSSLEWLYSIPTEAIIIE